MYSQNGVLVSGRGQVTGQRQVVVFKPQRVGANGARSRCSWMRRRWADGNSF